MGVFNGREMATGVLQWSTAAPAAWPAILLPGRVMIPEAEAIRHGMPRAQEPNDAPGEKRHAGA